MDDGAVLHLAVFADGDGVVITAQYTIIPNAGVLLQHHVAYDDCIICNPKILTIGGDVFVAERINHVSVPSVGIGP